MGDLKGFFKEVRAGVALYLEVSGDLGHRRQSADLTAIHAVTPGGMVFIHGMNLNGEHDDHQPQCHQCVGQQGEVITCQQFLTVQVCQRTQRHQMQGDQRQGQFFLTRGDLCVEHGNKQQDDSI